MARRRNPGKIRPYNSKPNAAYLKAFAAEYNRISRAVGGHDADVSKYGNFGENGSAHWNYLRPFYQMGATAVEAARFAAADQRDPYYWKFHAETEPLLPEVPKIKAWTYAMRNEYGRGYQRWNQKFLDESFKEHLERTTQSMAREMQEERVRKEKRSAFLVAHKFARDTVARLRAEREMRAFLEASRRERAEEMGPSTAPYFADTDYEAARRRGAALEVNPRPTRRKDFVTTCLGAKGEDVREMLDRKEHRTIRRRTFMRHVGAENWRDFLSRVGHVRGVRTPLSFGRSTYRGKPCVYVRWSGVEYIYNPPRRPARRELRLGLREEREHDDVTGGDPRLVRRIALAHLREDPRYYTKLARCFRKNPLSSLILKQVPGGFASGEVTTWPEFRRSMEGSAFDHELDRAGRFVAGRKKVLDLKFLEVDRDRRGTGIGRRLATAVERAGRRRGARASLLVASRVDERAKHPAAFWKRMGYKRFSGASRGDGLFAKLMNGRRRARRRA